MVFNNSYVAAAISLGLGALAASFFGVKSPTRLYPLLRILTVPYFAEWDCRMKARVLGAGVFEMSWSALGERPPCENLGGLNLLPQGLTFIFFG